MRLALRGVDCCGRLLDGIGNPIEFRRVPPVPQGIQVVGIAFAVIGSAGFGDDGVGAAGPGETGGFGKAAKFDRHFFRPFDFIYRMRQGIIADEGFIGRIKKNEGVVVTGEIDPSAQRFTTDGRSGRIVGKAKVNQVNRFFREVGQKAILRCARQIDNAAISAVFDKYRCVLP